MKSPEVSIIVPTFNRLRYLRPAVDSVLAQSFSDWELIVADDGSQGETASYLAALHEPPRIRVLRLPHTGNPGAVRNAALRAARGDYIAFLDSDDVWLPEKLALQLASLRSHPQRGWSHTAFALIDESGQVVTGAGARSWPATEGGILERLVRMDLVIAMPTVMVRRQLLEQFGEFDCSLRMCEDYDLWLRLAAVSEVDGVRERLAHVRGHGERFHKPPVVLEDRARVLEKLLTTNDDRRIRSTVLRERARVAVAVARSQATQHRRWAALQTLVKSSHYSWGYGEWWVGGVGAAARAVAPAGVLRAARAVVRRSPPA
jgi:glycosyltransferase involved in cell wall biosynthesis